jgi:peptidyl-prolyl cis-trans isomerase C
MNKVNASHILVKTKEEADYCLNLIKAGKNFEELATEKSLCSSKKRGGSLGWFSRGQMVKEFEQACFNSKKGQIIGPIKTQFGYHIIKINDTAG